MTISPDGNPLSGSISGGNTVTSATFTTALSNDVIVVDVYMQYVMTTGGAPRVTSITGSGLSFSRKSRTVCAYSSFANFGYMVIERWWAPAASTFSNTISITTDQSIDAWNYIISAWNGVGNTAWPWDSSTGFVVQNSQASGSPVTPTVSFSTSNAPNLILASALVVSQTGGIGIPNGYNSVGSVVNAGGLQGCCSDLGYLYYGGQQLNTVINWLLSANMYLITVDALTAQNLTQPSFGGGQSSVG